MKDLINNLVAIYTAAIADSSFSAKKVFKGLQDAPQMASFKTQYPYLMIDNGGSRVEDTSSDTAQNRIYSVVMEFATYSAKDISEAMDNIADLEEEVKSILELPENKQKDGHVWAVQMIPFDWDEDAIFFRGERIIVDFVKLEDRPFNW